MKSLGKPAGSSRYCTFSCLGPQSERLGSNVKTQPPVGDGSHKYTPFRFCQEDRKKK